MIPKVMKAAVVKQFGKPLQIEQVPIPPLQTHQILVQIKASGICHTDLHAANGDWPVKPKLPLIPGHQGIGIVVAKGSSVNNVKQGDTVGIPWLTDCCGQCPFCYSGWQNLCLSQKNIGYNVNGGYAEYVIAHGDFVGKFHSKNIDFVKMAPILCAGVTVYKGLKQTQVKPGQWVAISGIGGLGHLAVQYAKAMGMHVVAVDIADDKLQLGKKLGAEMVLKSDDKAGVEKLMKQTLGGVHGTLVTAVQTTAFQFALNLMRRKGTLSMIGIPPGSFQLPIFNMILNRLTVRGSIVGNRLDLQQAISFAEEGKVKAIVKGRKLEQINQIFDEMKKGKIEGRIALDFSK